MMFHLWQRSKSIARLKCRRWVRNALVIWILFIVMLLVTLSDANERARKLVFETTAVAESDLTAASQVAFQTVAKGYRSGLREPAQTVVRSQSEWNALWQKHSSIETNPPPPPAIDLNKEIVIGVFLGEKPTGGYDVEIVSVERSDGTLTVSFKEKSPQPGGITTQAFTQPFHIVRIATTGSEKIVFRRLP